MGTTEVQTRAGAVRVLLVVCGLWALVGLTACWGPPPSPSYADPYAAQQRYREQATKFAQSLINETYQSSYNLCSSQLKARESFDAFTQAHQAAGAQYGRPDRFELTVDATDLAAIKADSLGIPTGLPPDLCRAWVTITYFSKPDAQGKAEPFCTLRALLVEDTGKERVGFYQYAPYQAKAAGA